MDGAMGPEEEVVEAVLTCEGDFHDPQLHSRIERFRHRLKDLLHTEKQKLLVKKVEPWNSVKVTFTIPREAAVRLQQLAQAGSDALRQIGVLSVQIQGDSQISLTIAGRNNEPTQLVLRTPAAAPATPAVAGAAVGTSGAVAESGLTSSDEFASSPGPSHDEQTKKNIVEYLRQGPPVRHNAVLDSILGTAGLGVPASESFPGTAPPLRPNMVSGPGQKPRGSQPSSNNFPFSKTAGAFHPPVPRLPASAGQSTITSTHHMQSFNPAGSGGVRQQRPDFASNGFPGPLHHMGAGAPPRLSPVPMGSSLPSSSSPSNFMIDLPPPPPYPHTGNSSKSNKTPVTPSSPLLVNLLQTDPLAVAAGGASGNPGKPLKDGESIPANGPPPKKKRRPKKPKEGMMKPVPLTDTAVSSGTRPIAFQGVSPMGLGPDGLPTHSRAPGDHFTSGFMSSRPGAVPMNHIPDSFLTSRVSFPSDRPFGEGLMDRPSSSGRSAIPMGSTSSSVSDTNGQDADPFSSEIAAGKIVNPYTGQLEPRDSVMDSSGQLRLRGQMTNSQEDNFAATQILAKKAKELEESTKKSVPISTTQMLDVNVMRTTFPSSLSVTASTAAIVSSGGPSQLMSSVPSHRRNLISDGSHSDRRESPPQTGIYAGNPSLCPDVISNSSSVTVPGTITKSLPHPMSSLGLNPALPAKPFVPSSVSVNGPLSGAQLLKRKSPALQQQQQQQQHMCVSPLLPSGSVPPQGSVIYSSVTCSNPAMSQPQVTLAPTPASVPHLRLPSSSSSGVQGSERLKLADSHLSFPQQNQAASSTVSLGSSYTATTSSPNLLNSVPEKHMDSHSSAESPTDNKLSSEGDENSNHSVTNADNLPEGSGTTALLEHSGVKSENHDSGIGSSSERSDDTPSEPGDGEFRSTQSAGDTEDSGSKPAQKVHEVKTESKLDSSSTTITVGYMISPGDSHVKPSLAKDMGHSGKAPSPQPLSKSDLSTFLDSHKSELLSSSSQQTSPAMWAAEVNKQEFSNHLKQHSKQNGPLIKDLANYPTMNGPSSQNNIDKMVLEMIDIQQKKAMNSKLPDKDVTGDASSQSDVMEKLSKLHHLGETSKESLEALRLTGLDKSPDNLLQGLGDNRPDQLSIYEVEELVNGKLLASNGGEGKGGSNITSIYSKRSSPVNVNMLNHIYAPGLPLPRRLTESVQRLVKPLPASESSMPHVRPCKSPGSGGSPRAGNINGQGSSRLALQSGARSPGASMPKLIPNDKHSLLSERLDLAGLSSLHYSSSEQDLLSSLANYSKEQTSAEALLKDLHHGSLSQLSPPSLFDSKSHRHNNKLLSQSYPPHKTRDLSINTNSLAHLHSHMNSLERKSMSPPFFNSHPVGRSVAADVGKVVDPGGKPVSSSVPGMPALYSMSSGETVQSSDSACSSPSMPVLQQGQEPPNSLLSSQPHRNAVTGPPTLSKPHHVPYSVSSEHSSSRPPLSSGSDSVGMGSTPPKLSKVLNAVSPTSLRPSGGLQNRNLFESVSGSFVHDGPSSGSKSPISSQCTNNEPINSVLVSMDSDSNLTVRNVRHKVPQIDLSPTKMKTFEVDSKNSGLNAVTTEVVNLDFSTSQLPTLNSLPSIPSKNDLLLNPVKPPKFSSSVTVPQSLPVNASGPSHFVNKSSPATMSSVSSSPVKEPILETLANSLGSAVAPSSNPPHPPPVVSTTSDRLPPVTLGHFPLASASSSCPPPETSSAQPAAPTTTSAQTSLATTRSSHPVMSPAKPANSLTVTIKSANSPSISIKPAHSAVPIQVKSAPQRTTQAGCEDPTSNAVSRTHEEMPSLQNDTAAMSCEIPPTNPANQDGPDKRITRKRKNTNSDSDSVEKDDMPPLKKANTACTPTKPNSEKQPTGVDGKEEGDVRKAQEISSVHTTSEPKTELTKQPLTEKAVEKDSLGKTVNAHSHQLSNCEDEEEVKGNNVNKLPKSELSLDSAEGAGHKDSSVESKESRPHRTSVASERPHRSHATTPQAQSSDKDLLQFSREPPPDLKTYSRKDTSHLNKASSHPKEQPSSEGKTVPHKEASSKEIGKSQHVPNSIPSKEEERRPSFSKREEGGKGKPNSGKGMPASEKPSVESKNDVDGGKRVHRVKRQFYTYVPEKSIDQTYFDTPILTGRTRSRNKPSDGAASHSDAGPQGPAVQESPVGMSLVEATTQQSNAVVNKVDQQAAPGSAADSGKRSTRSHKVKETPQDPSVNKRRRVNPRDQR